MCSWKYRKNEIDSLWSPGSRVHFNLIARKYIWHLFQWNGCTSAGGTFWPDKDGSLICYIPCHPTTAAKWTPFYQLYQTGLGLLHLSLILQSKILLPFFFFFPDVFGKYWGVAHWVTDWGHLVCSGGVGLHQALCCTQSINTAWAVMVRTACAVTEKGDTGQGREWTVDWIFLGWVGLKLLLFCNIYFPWCKVKGRWCKVGGAG
jgi:hypothetical protein